MRHCGTLRLETPRLILRPFVLEDVQAMFDNWATDPRVSEFLTWDPHGNVEETRALVAGWIDDYASPDWYDWVIEDRQTGALIGNISVVRLNEAIDEAELGYCLAHAWWGQGRMTEACRAVIDFLFERVGANRVCAKHDVDNPRSGRVMIKAGMTFEGVRRQGFRAKRGLVDVACYAVLKGDKGA